MPKIKSKVVRVKDAEGIWHDLPAVVSMESLRASDRAAQSEASAAASAAAAQASAEYNAQLPVVEAMEAARNAAASAQEAAETAGLALTTANGASTTADAAAEAANNAVRNATAAAVEATSVSVSAWLDNHVDPVGSAVVVDNTLSIDGAAADAEIAGIENARLDNTLAFHSNTTAGTWTADEAYLTPSNVTSMTVGGAVATSDMSCGYMECESGDTFYITGTGSSGAKLWVWIESDGTIINRAASNAAEENLKLTAPEDAAYLLYNAFTAYPHYVIKGETSVTADVDDVRNIVGSILATDRILNGWTSGYYNTILSVEDITVEDITPDPIFMCQYVACKQDDVFYLTGTGGSGGKLWVWTDDDGVILDRAASSAVGNHLKLVAPEDAAYLLVNVDSTLPNQLERDVRCNTHVHLIFNTVNDMVAYTGLTSNMIVRTLGYNRVSDGMGCSFLITTHDYDYTGRVNIGYDSLYAVPLFYISYDNNKPTGPVTEMVRLAETYMQSGVEFEYARDGEGTLYPTAFDPAFDPGDTPYHINCNTLSRLMLYGIDFAHSKYGGGDNKHGQGYWANLDFVPRYNNGVDASAAGQALYCAHKGWAYKPNADFSNVRCGDLVFFSFSDDSHSARFMGIDHVAIFLGICGYDGNNKPRYQFIGNNGSQNDRTIETFFYTDNDDYMDYLVLCAGFAKQPTQEPPENIVLDPYTARTAASGTQGVYTYELAKELKSYKMYTLIVDCDVAPGTLSFRIGSTIYMSCDGTSHNTAMNPLGATHGVFHLVAPDLSGLSSSDKKGIRVFRYPTTDALTVNEFKVYDGWV